MWKKGIRSRNKEKTTTTTIIKKYKDVTIVPNKRKK